MSTPTSAPTGNLPTARLEVPTWTYHHEPPATVDPALDRKTDRLFTIARALYWTTGAYVLVVFPVLAVTALASPVVLLTGMVVSFGASLVVGLWHQQLRKHTGVPVVPILVDILEPFSSSMRSFREALDITLEDIKEGSLEDTPEWRELQQSARGALKAHRKATRELTRQFAIHCELAAQADRRGWQGLRDRHVRTIARLVLHATPQQSEPGVAEDAAHD